MSKTDTIQPYLGVDVTQDDFDRWLDDTREQLSVENLRQIGEAGNPAFQNSWVNFDTVKTSAAFYKDPFSRAWLEGNIKSGTVGAVPAFTLPEGYIPKKTSTFSSVDGAGTPSARVVVRGLSESTAGQVEIASGNNAQITLDGISFKI